MILSIIRKIRDLVEFGRVQHDFADSDSEEDAVVQDEAVKKNLYSTLLFHANGLVTLLGEFLESVSSIQRLVGSIKSKANDLETKALPRPPSEQVVPELIPESTPSVGSFLIDEPRPVKHLDPAMIRKLKRKTPFKAMAEKVRRSFSDFAKKSTHSLLTIFPPLGDGTNEGFHWDSYSDGVYDSEEWQTTEMSSSHIGFEDSFVRSALATPISPSTVSEKRRRGHHRRLSSKDSSGLPDQYWPGSIKLGQLDEMIGPARPAPPHPLSALSYDMNRDMFQDRIVDPRLYSTNTRLSSESRRESVQLGLEMHDTKRRDSVQTQAFTTASSSSSLLTPTRPFSTVSSGSDSYSPSRNNYKVRPPLPPAVLPSLPPSPTQSFFMAEEMMQETTSLQRKAANRTSLYLATRHSPPYQHAPLILDSPFTRQTIIRMGSDRNRYSVRMPSDDVAREPSITMTTRSFPASFWRRRSMNDNVERGWNLMRRRGSLVSATSGPSNPSSLSTPLSPEFDKQSKASVTLSSFEFAVPLFPRENSVRESRQSLEEGRGSTRPSLSMELSGNRRHSCPLSSSAEMALDEALSRRQSLSSQHTAAAATAQSSRSQDSTEQGPKRAVMESTPLPMTMADPSSMTDSLETMSSPLRPRLPPKAHSHSHYQRLEGGHGGSADVNSPETQAQDAALVARRPVSTSRFGDMKRAWEILNLDVKRVNQYSHLRAYARAYTQQNNHWALNHPNALQSSTSPQVLHICQNGVDVLVMEMFTDHLQVVAGQLDKLIERLADENAQDGEYVSCFLLSHSFFIDSEDLLDRLIARFHIQPRQGEILYFQKWHTVIQCKVLCVLHRWIQLQYEDFELNPNLLKTVKKFLEVDVRRCGFANEAEYIQENISIKTK
ncbi:hypothetical protein BGW38_005445 [Lunasporangiospora selenospora]|uniref:N-terminal Ras-GEF domain-containing protein n=1 Tax=Lunasporangiospora selenospora TaxID=979761 RepID=A0A9P6FNR9_9FUNG|nr:hypothetical protein BGW38_005445 [Lunasporangiospora selenospora]